MLSILRQFWAELNTPSDFARDPYSEGANQLGHTMISIVACVLFVCVWREVAGEMPYRTPTFAIIFFGYLICIEIMIQKWKPGDSWFDSAMIAAGAAGVLYPFKEISVSGSLTTLSFDHRKMIVIIFVWVVFLGWRLWQRMVRKYG